jgi:choline kinase
MAKAIILAAGMGTRLRPYTENLPKCLVSVSGKSLLQRQVAVLNSCGVTEIFVVGGYKAEKFEESGFRLVLNHNWRETNMLNSLFAVEQDFDEDLIIAYGDIVYSQHILSSLLASREDIAVAIDLNWRRYWSQRMENPELDVESLRLDMHGRIIEIGLQPRSLDEVEGQYMGLFKLSTNGWRAFRERYDALGRCGAESRLERDRMAMTSFLNRLIAQGVCIMSVLNTWAWVEVDTVSDLRLPATLERLSIIDQEIAEDTYG